MYEKRRLRETTQVAQILGSATEGGPNAVLLPGHSEDSGERELESGCALTLLTAGGAGSGRLLCIRQRQEARVLTRNLWAVRGGPARGRRQRHLAAAGPPQVGARALSAIAGCCSARGREVAAPLHPTEQSPGGPLPVAGKLPTAGTRARCGWPSSSPAASPSGRCSPRALLFYPVLSEALFGVFVFLP